MGMRRADKRWTLGIAVYAFSVFMFVEEGWDETKRRTHKIFQFITLLAATKSLAKETPFNATARKRDKRLIHLRFTGNNTVWQQWNLWSSHLLRSQQNKWESEKEKWKDTKQSENKCANLSYISLVSVSSSLASMRERPMNYVRNVELYWLRNVCAKHKRRRKFPSFFFSCCTELVTFIYYSFSALWSWLHFGFASCELRYRHQPCHIFHLIELVFFTSNH